MVIQFTGEQTPEPTLLQIGVDHYLRRSLTCHSVGTSGFACLDLSGFIVLTLVVATRPINPRRVPDSEIMRDSSGMACDCNGPPVQEPRPSTTTDGNGMKIDGYRSGRKVTILRVPSCRMTPTIGIVLFHLVPLSIHTTGAAG
jgi:hypothetical protein